MPGAITTTRTGVSKGRLASLRHKNSDGNITTSRCLNLPTHISAKQGIHQSNTNQRMPSMGARVVAWKTVVRHRGYILRLSSFLRRVAAVAPSDLSGRVPCRHCPPASQPGVRGARIGRGRSAACSYLERSPALCALSGNSADVPRSRSPTRSREKSPPFSPWTGYHPSSLGTRP